MTTAVIHHCTLWPLINFSYDNLLTFLLIFLPPVSLKLESP